MTTGPGPAGPGANRVAALVETLAEQGFAVAPDFLDADLVSALAREALERDRARQTDTGGVGRKRDYAVDRTVRRARICWFDGSSPAQGQFLEEAERLRQEINRRLFLGVFEFEAQFAVYDAGGFYARHLDSFRGRRNRVVSLVAYLNADWQAGDGGTLAIWPAGTGGDAAAAPVAEVLPRAGTVVAMLSEEIPHEVRPAGRQRLSVAGWWRVNQMQGGRIDPPRISLC
ncbi:2OG-Fe(II) oxygenase [Kaustia mangrovi]|uniref:2OG-Fe(II) oxygenase n=1 Tax=Kaustia mangrovi TaxID=2593653 RepID=A0A7S8C5G9_9HYPH|nr:2OG-Fe(II) oxygenase [Kaustia mangrovi]QPC43743.1 2OG-Fe(II) oxygenase [Kaustia mangrovi]